MTRPDRIERVRKPMKCPRCGCKPVAEIHYGMPVFTPKLEKQLNDGAVRLGCCVITGDDPAWECAACGQQIYRRVE